ncbi:hypothetical protein [Burkholderia contaminans]|uniref:Diguanylate cyclase n=1 Tax=Burkholderia contaminans TaxID=488447 RepID=A0A6P3BWY1_9BURK|nr:hypothetical protein [Burkholderia contaminans]VWD60888.1 diguanylate cyclase [Burkholderia contaminans]
MRAHDAHFSPHLHRFVSGQNHRSADWQRGDAPNNARYGPTYDPVSGLAAGTNDAADARGCDIRFSVGHVDCDPAHHRDVAGLLASADQRIYEDKQRGKTAGT